MPIVLPLRIHPARYQRLFIAARCRASLWRVTLPDRSDLGKQREIIMIRRRYCKYLSLGSEDIQIVSQSEYLSKHSSAKYPTWIGHQLRQFLSPIERLFQSGYHRINSSQLEIIIIIIFTTIDHQLTSGTWPLLSAPIGHPCVDHFL